ncbi:spectrin beta chain, non-erythrocytic 4-like [Cricetulus griseus]|uniref:spectrin beta chain, non-erythrocytic 4-like n=1 Tax=Cricetulus griseus TaxID=10029 RepID=UPI0015C3DB8F|nr:spectrin beta chain, non-erythrocytic 4-like [Cricetulus griseus]
MSLPKTCPANYVTWRQQTAQHGRHRELVKRREALPVRPKREPGGPRRRKTQAEPERASLHPTVGGQGSGKRRRRRGPGSHARGSPPPPPPART